MSIKSKFIANVLDLLLDGDELGEQAKQQIDFLTEKNFNYTGVGLFVSFTHNEGIQSIPLKGETVINGLVITSPELGAGAEASVCLKEGLIDYLEIWSYDGVYPEQELTRYTLTQGWVGSPGKKVEV